MIKQPFTICPHCGTAWEDQHAFVVDQATRMDEYTANFERLDQGLFLFTHAINECGATFSLRVKDFLNLYHGPIYKECRTGKKYCPGFCLDKKNLQRCQAFCSCAYVRNLIQILQSEKLVLADSATS